MLSRTKLDPRDVHVADSDWKVHRITPDTIYYRHYLGPDSWIEKAEHIQDEELIALNQQEFNDSLTKRFSDDAVGTKVASIPLHIYYREIAPYQTAGDKDHLKWWLDQEANRPYRTFRGQIQKGKR